LHSYPSMTSDGRASLRRVCEADSFVIGVYGSVHSSQHAECVATARVLASLSKTHPARQGIAVQAMNLLPRRFATASLSEYSCTGGSSVSPHVPAGLINANVA
jgi:hypothetical protein